MLLVRDYIGVKGWGEEGQRSLEKVSRGAASTLEDIADIINVALEQLVRQRFELPAFTLIHRAAQHARATVNREYQAAVCDRLDDTAQRNWRSCFAGPKMTARAHGIDSRVSRSSLSRNTTEIFSNTWNG